MYQMSNEDLDAYIANIPAMKEKVKAVDKKKVARSKKKVADILSTKGKKVVRNG